MTLPPHLLVACEALLRSIPYKQLEKGAEELSKAYRVQSAEGKVQKPFMRTPFQKIAYLALRFPATYAAIGHCLKEIKGPIDSLLDVGSGPGTLLFALDELFPGLKDVTLVEGDPELVCLGESLLKSRTGVFPKYVVQDMRHFCPERTYGLVSAAYAMGELDEADFEGVLKALWGASDRYLFLIEPGTPYGFRAILRARTHLIALGASIVAPCTHENRCPLAEKNDWCHFSIRLERSELQRLVKSASLGYEDEKYSYLIATKKPVMRSRARIVKSPERHHRHLRLTLCSSQGLTEEVVSARNKEAYRLAKKLEWGDSCDILT